ncbi:ATP-binding protein [Ralstonia mannitolilytica]|uniref:ATP-binding protein n=1 Tax=Ralstonia mannitolilytica TaxID=105219 RepID=UPI0028F58C38|nr:ATP-binding protein [Ralstonia mannitolilytica]CAJ0738606.1 hypothetical protein R76696_02039 [Ralstonia mannitolilytica]
MEFTSLYDIKSWLEDVDRLGNTGTCSSPRFLKPFHFVTLAMEMKRRGGAKLKLPDALCGYAARMKLWHVIGEEPPVHVNEYTPAGRFHPLEALLDENAVAEVSRGIVEIFKANGQDEKSVDAADTMVRELLSNCFAHAESDIGLHGLACAQWWPKANKAQIAICDSGIGIRQSLDQSGIYEAALAGGNSCELATQYQVTSKPGKGHSGYGLTLARDLIEQNAGAIFVISHGEYFYSKNCSTHSGVLDTPHPGTLLVLEWNTNTPLDLKQVYDGWPAIEGANGDDDFDF